MTYSSAFVSSIWDSVKRSCFSDIKISLCLCLFVYLFIFSKVYVFVHFNSTEDGEKNDQDTGKDLLIETPSEEEKKPPKRRCGQKKEQPEAIMASFFAGLDVYQTKILVSHFSIISWAGYNKKKPLVNQHDLILAKL